MNRKAIVIVIILFLISRSFSIVTVSGDSMLGSIHDGDKLIGSIYWKLNRGDVVLVHVQGVDMVKRVIGISGDHLQVKNNTLFVNGTVQEEDYLYEDMITLDFDLIVPEGCVFVMGDNRNISNDSRSFGCISTECVYSKVMASF